MPRKSNPDNVLTVPAPFILPDTPPLVLETPPIDPPIPETSIISAMELIADTLDSFPYPLTPSMKAAALKLYNAIEGIAFS